MGNIEEGSPVAAEVQALQTNLNTLGAKLIIDGDFGPTTLAAVESFQKNNGLNVDGIDGPATQTAILKALARLDGQPKYVVPLPTLDPKDPTPWLTVLNYWASLGLTENTGQQATPFDQACIAATDYGPLENNVMVAGCGATMSLVMKILKINYPSGSAAAKRWDIFGAPSALKAGALCRFQFTPADEHITCCASVNPDGTGIFTGGNQSHMVKASKYPIAQIVAIRWPNSGGY